MKKYVFIFLILSLLFSCEKDIKLQCEENYFGTIEVINQSDYSIWVNIYTYQAAGYPTGVKDDIKLRSGESVTFSEVETGEMYHLVSMDKLDWVWNSNRETLLSCDEAQWVWTNDKLYDVFQNYDYNWNYYIE